METSKFSSQICTTKEQSERLLTLGLKKETADMKHFFDNRNDYSFFHRWKCCPYKWDEESLTDSENIPAWSLHRLIEISQLPQSWQCLSGDWYNEVIAHIQSMIHINQFNKEYLDIH